MTGQREQMVLVPRIPTKEMIDAAWEGALAESAKTVWELMIEEYETSRKHRVGVDR